MHIFLGRVSFKPSIKPLFSKARYSTDRALNTVLPPGAFLTQYEASTKLSALFLQADNNKKTYIARNRLDSNSVVDWFRVRLGYTSNALEGNTLSEKDVYMLVKEGITIGGKPIRDMLDVTAHDKAVRLLFDAAYQTLPLEPALIKSLHQAALPPPERESDPPLGEYKKYMNFTFTNYKGSSVMRAYVEPEDVRDRIAELMFWLRDNEKQIHPIALAAIGHYNFVTIHPFPDGNGRVGRLLMNILLLRQSFTPVIIETFQKQAYIEAIEGARVNNDVTPFVEFLAETMIDTQKPLLDMSSFVRKDKS